jgi:hypothetical protein
LEFKKLFVVGFTTFKNNPILPHNINSQFIVTTKLFPGLNIPNVIWFVDIWRIVAAPVQQTFGCCHSKAKMGNYDWLNLVANSPWVKI